MRGAALPRSAGQSLRIVAARSAAPFIGRMSAMKVLVFRSHKEQVHQTPITGYPREVKIDLTLKKHPIPGARADRNRRNLKQTRGRQACRGALDAVQAGAVPGGEWRCEA